MVNINRAFYQSPLELIRCVQTPDNRVLADLHHELPSDKPLYLGAYPDVWQRAIKHDLATEWFGEDVQMDATTVAQLQRSCLQAVWNTLAMAHKSGACVLGLDLVMRALGERDTELVIIAKDAGGSDKKRLLNNPLTARYCHVFGERAELGAVFRRRAQVYLAVREGALAEKLTFFLRLHTRFNEHLAL